MLMSRRGILLLCGLAVATLPGLSLGGPYGVKPAEIQPARILLDGEKVETYGQNKWAPSSTKDGTGIVICGGQFSRGKCRVESEGMMGVLGAKESAPVLPLSEAIAAVNPQAKLIDAQVQGRSLKVYYRVDTAKPSDLSEKLPTGFGIDFKGNSSDAPIINFWDWVGFWAVVLALASVYVIWSFKSTSVQRVVGNTAPVTPSALSHIPIPTYLPTSQVANSIHASDRSQTGGLSPNHEIAKRKIILD
ncbi:TPA: hypothetical protein ACGW3N_000098 [Pseudomonas aeruginosa]|uniref:hypothetical protein n=2 Tax=Pseudomonas TaxID=286 RepID=UPI0011462500|nr:hypothetical protein [Pseudomonas sp. AU12215]MBI8852202.1 hypothetical protein [Pseudomonas aeruginosa]HDU2624988.1 hypothetical protein [Pseudomonas aeruginosa]HDU2625818.1 hypothetical protein [Pseudomonas aeruginosa]